MLKLTMRQTLKPKLLFNIGALMDIPTGCIVTGNRGESIINGGLGSSTAVVGIGNNFKSQLIHFMMLQAVNRLRYTDKNITMNTYDTEVNMMPDRLKRLTTNMDNIHDDELFKEDGGLWSITDKTEYYAEVWANEVKDYLNAKMKEKSLDKVYTPFSNSEGKPIVLKKPDFIEIDSFTEFEGTKTVKTLDDNNLDDSSTNTVYMQQGLLKAKFLGELPRYSVGSNTYFLFTAQLGKDIDMQSGPIRKPPTKKLQYLKNGDKIKGVTDKFFFLMSNAWNASNAAPFINQTTKLPEYPISKEMSNDRNELNIVKLTMLRSKSGPTGYTLDILVSQKEGILPSLTEFHYIKTNGRFGLGGNDRNYYLELKPEVKLSRTTIRSKLSNDSKLRRAVNITSELLQMTNFWNQYIEDGLYCTPKELYEDLKDLGYDWDILLDTRGWWSPDQYKHPIPFLSTFDLLKMRKKLYNPYWLKK